MHCGTRGLWTKNMSPAGSVLLLEVLEETEHCMISINVCSSHTQKPGLCRGHVWLRVRGSDYARQYNIMEMQGRRTCGGFLKLEVSCGGSP